MEKKVSPWLLLGISIVFFIVVGIIQQCSVFIKPLKRVQAVSVAKKSSDQLQGPVIASWIRKKDKSLEKGNIVKVKAVDTGQEICIPVKDGGYSNKYPERAFDLSKKAVELLSINKTNLKNKGLYQIYWKVVEDCK